jgi:hypothetical protein
MAPPARVHPRSRVYREQISNASRAHVNAPLPASPCGTRPRGHAFVKRCTRTMHRRLRVVNDLKRFLYFLKLIVH